MPQTFPSLASFIYKYHTKNSLYFSMDGFVIKCNLGEVQVRVKGPNPHSWTGAPETLATPLHNFPCNLIVAENQEGAFTQ